MECLSTISYYYMLNGGLTKPFQSRRVLRKRDPMSPYIFVISIKYLHIEIQYLGQQKIVPFSSKIQDIWLSKYVFWKWPINVLQGWKRFYLVAPKVLKSIWTGRKCRQSFYLYGGSRYQSKVWSVIDLGIFRKDITIQAPESSTIYKEADNCTMYASSGEFLYKITWWTTRLLSYFGRLQLIKEVLFGMQSYWAHIFILPKKVTKMLQTICRTFLWTGQCCKRKLW